MDERFDAIIVGGGLAGLTAAYVMAQEGLMVALVERGDLCGMKNVTGGKICSHSIEKVFPDFARIAPVEREITQVKVKRWAQGETADAGISPDEYGLSETKAYSVIRRKLDGWFAKQAEDAGVMLISGIVVNDLIVRDGAVRGIVAGEDELEANVVILAEGVNGMLAQKLGMLPELSADETCVGTKEVIALDEKEISRRFGLNDGEGAELMYLGDRSKGQYADGFVYTNKDSVSVGIEFLISDISKTEKSVPEMLEEFKALPEIGELISGGRLVEYSAHLVGHGAPKTLPKLYGDGVLLAGDAARLTANFGWAIRGMDMAVESGRLAAETVLHAAQTGAFSAAALAPYQRAVEESFIGADMEACRRYWEGRH